MQSCKKLRLNKRRYRYGITALIFLHVFMDAQLFQLIFHTLQVQLIRIAIPLKHNTIYRKSV